MASTRRSFLIGATAAALAPAAPGDRINMGFVGLGGMGTGRLRQFLAQPDVNVTAVCDLDENHLSRAVEIVTKERGVKPAAIHDFRKLVERKDVDAVMVATPDHWHALATIHACEAGKDVFTEKPLCHSLNEGRAMVAAAKRHNRITQLGNHIHNDLPNYRRVVELVRSGILGNVHQVYCWIRSGDKGMGHPPDGTPPKELDWEFWLGPAPRHAYNPNRSHGTFRYFWDYSGGVFIDFWCHITDVAYWALDLQAPKSVAAMGGRFVDDNAETPNVMSVVYEYPGIVLNWNVSPVGQPGFEQHHIGCVFQGSKSTLFTNYEQHELYVGGKRVTDFQRPAQSIPDSPGHIREFLDSVRSRKPTSCNIEYAYRLTKGGLLGNIAYRTGRRIQWDDARGAIVGDSKAQAMTERHYRKPWRLA